MEHLEVGQVWISNSSNGDCGLIITELKKNDAVVFRGFGRHIGLDILDGKTKRAFIISGFDLVDKLPSWAPKFPQKYHDIMILK